MKIVRYLIPAALVLLLVGCFDITEEIDIKNNGSGQMLVNMDMSQLLEIMQTYVGKDEMDKQLPKKTIDTTLLMKDVIDTAQNITPEKKALLRKGRVHMKMNMDEKVFKADINLPFDNLHSLQQLYTSMNDGSLGTSKLFKGLGPPSGDTSAQNAQMPDLSQFNGIYDFHCSDGMISRKLNAAKWKAFQDSPQFEQVKEVKSMGMEVPYTLKLNLPRPIKKVDNPIAQVSEDKKTVTIKYNFMDVFNNPEKFEYTVTY